MVPIGFLAKAIERPSTLAALDRSVSPDVRRLRKISASTVLQHEADRARTSPAFTVAKDKKKKAASESRRKKEVRESRRVQKVARETIQTIRDRESVPEVDQ